MLHAEQKCGTSYHGYHPWSPDLKAAMDFHRFWCVLVRKRQGHQHHWRTILRLAKRAGAEQYLSCSLEDAVAHRRAAQRQYRKVKRQSISHRAKWLEDLAMAKAEAEGGDAERIIRELQQREHTQRRFATISKVVKSQTRRGLTMVQVQQGDDLITHTTQEAIEQACLQENESRFRQASHTPLNQPAALDTFGATGGEKATDNLIQDGDIPSNVTPLHPLMREYLGAHHTPHCEQLNLELDQAEYARSWKRAKERTSSGMSGIHFGHFIANTQHPDILKFDTMMAQLPWQYGFYYRRWTKGLNVMLEKQEGNYRVHKLRAILLLKADFNHGNKWIGKEAMAHAEQHHLIAPEQYGGRKHMEFNTASVNKILTFDISRQNKQRMALCSVDAKSCYDRIVHPAAALAMRRVGVPHSAITAMLSTIQELDNHVRTAFGDSTTSFPSNDQSGTPIGGICQGNGAGPTIWNLVSTPLLEAMRRRGHCVNYADPITGIRNAFAGFIFVNNLDLAVTDFTPEAAQSLIKDIMQSSLGDWNGHLTISGGALVPDKCFNYTITFNWNKNGDWNYDVYDTSACTLYLDQQGNHVYIEQLNVADARRTLGIRIAPDGNMDAKFDHRASQIKNGCSKISLSRLPSSLVWTSLQTGLLPQITACLSASTFSYAQCQRLESMLYPTALPRCQVNRHFPSSMRTAPAYFNGLGLTDLYVLQGLRHLLLLTIFGHRQDTITGHMFRVSFHTILLELGTFSNPFLLDHGDWRYLASNTWLTHTWDFMAKYSIRLRVPTPTAPSASIMELFRLNDYNRTQLQQLNKCRLFLQLMWPHELFITGSDRIHPTLLRHQRREQRSPYQWPNQGKPPRQMWQLWDTAIRLLRHRTPRPATTTLLSYAPVEWFYSVRSNLLFRKLSTLSYQVFSEHRPSKYCRNQDPPIIWNWLTTRRYRPFVATEVQQTRDSWHLIGSNNRRLLDHQIMTLTLPSLPWTLQATTAIQKDCAWCTQHTTLPLTSTTVQRLGHLLTTDTLHAAADGSHKHPRSSAGWAFYPPKSATPIIDGGFLISDDHPDQDSYRAELGGILALLQVCTSLITHLHLPLGKLYLAIDNAGALQRVFEKKRPTRLSDSQWDMVGAIQTLLEQYPSLTITWDHVHGHQDQSFGPLTLLATRNVQMDSLAETARTTISAALPLPPLQALWTPLVASHHPTRNALFQLSNHCHRSRAFAYLSRKSLVNQPALVDWENRYHALHSQHQRRQLWITKHTLRGWCGVNRNKHRWKQSDTPNCPCCLTTVETELHVWQCPQDSQSELWDVGLADLDTLLRQLRSGRELTNAILYGLQSARYQITPTLPPSLDSSFHPAFQEQSLLGWDQAVQGRWSSKWATALDQWYTSIGLARSGNQWIQKITVALWSLTFTLWTARNDINQAKLDRERLDQLRTNITLAFQEGVDSVPSCYHQLFTSVPLVRRLRQSEQVQTSWLKRVRIAQTFGPDHTYHNLSPDDHDILESQQALQHERRQRQRQRRTALRHRQRQSTLMQTHFHLPTVALPPRRRQRPNLSQEGSTATRAKRQRTLHTISQCPNPP